VAEIRDKMIYKLYAESNASLKIIILKEEIDFTGGD
jgi:hypothetical protein